MRRAARRRKLLDRVVEHSPGALPDRRLKDADLEKKFLDNAGTRIPATQARALADMIWKLDEIADTRQLTVLLEA